jgi:hypothetical protein
MELKALSLAAIGAVAFVAPALAHHSFAMFDAEKTMTLNGTVTEFEWSNPHSWIRVLVPDQTGKPLQWAIEMNAPAQLTQRGWNPTIIKPGDKITLTMHPLKDGARGGQFVTATLADGKTLSNGTPVGRAN